MVDEQVGAHKLIHEELLDQFEGRVLGKDGAEGGFFGHFG